MSMARSMSRGRRGKRAWASSERRKALDWRSAAEKRSPAKVVKVWFLALTSSTIQEGIG